MNLEMYFAGLEDQPLANVLSYHDAWHRDAKRFVRRIARAVKNYPYPNKPPPVVVTALNRAWDSLDLVCYLLYL